METELRVCANCRVLVQPDGGTWIHVPAFAEKFTLNVCDTPEPGRPASGAESRFGLARIKTPGGDKQAIHDCIADLTLPAGAPIVVATGGSYKLHAGERVVKPMSWSYVATNGQYGLGTSIVPGTVVGDSRWLQAELRAMAAAVKALPGDSPITILAGSKDALNFFYFWRDGHQLWPYGYNPDRAGGRESTLGRLARRVHDERERINAEWVRGRSGHPLNEAAYRLARLARAWAADKLDKDTVAGQARATVRDALERHIAAVN